MDHVIDAINPFLDAEIEDLKEQFESGVYKRLQDCPSYEACKTLVNAIHVIERHYYGKERTLTAMQLVDV